MSLSHIITNGYASVDTRYNGIPEETVKKIIAASQEKYADDLEWDQVDDMYGNIWGWHYRPYNGARMSAHYNEFIERLHNEYMIHNSSCPWGSF